MKPGKPLQRTGFKRRTKGINKESAKHAAGQRELHETASTELIARSGGRCEFVGVGGKRCAAPAFDPHHVKLRDGTPGQHDIANLLHVCRAHHNFIHDNPALSYEHGYLKHFWED